MATQKKNPVEILGIILQIIQAIPWSKMFDTIAARREARRKLKDPFVDNDTIPQHDIDLANMAKEELLTINKSINLPTKTK